MTIWQKIRGKVINIGIVQTVFKVIIYATFVCLAICNIELPFLKQCNENVDFGYIMDLCVLIIGILLGILTIVATSDVPITKNLKEREKSDAFIEVISIGIIESFVTIIIIIFDFESSLMYQYLVFALTANVLFDFIYFFVLTIQMCKYNIRKSIEKEKSESMNINAALTDLQQIRMDVEKLKNQKINKNQ